MDTDLMFSSANMNWETPKRFVKLCEKTLLGGKRFTLDACAENKKVARAPRYYTPEQNALEQPWTGRVWMNPPYGRRIHHWVEKAFKEAMEHGATVCCLLPGRVDTQYFHDFCTRGGVHLVKGRLIFEQDGKPMTNDEGRIMPAPFPSMVVIFKRGLTPYIKPWVLPDTY